MLMNDLYVHQLETENKQLRLALQETRKVLEEQTKAIESAIEYIKQCGGMELVNDYSFPDKPIIDKEAKQELLEILGEKE